MVGEVALDFCGRLKNAVGGFLCPCWVNHPVVEWVSPYSPNFVSSRPTEMDRHWLVAGPLEVGEIFFVGELLDLLYCDPPPQQWNQSSGPCLGKILRVWEGQYLLSIANSSFSIAKADSQIPSAYFSMAPSTLVLPRTVFQQPPKKVAH